MTDDTWIGTAGEELDKMLEKKCQTCKWYGETECRECVGYGHYTPVSDTPRKDTALHLCHEGEDWVTAVFARKLERELADMTARAETAEKALSMNCHNEARIHGELNAKIRKLRRALNDACSVFSGHGQVVTEERLETWNLILNETEQ